MKRRKACKKLVSHRDEGGIYKKSIVWQYFALRNKTFDKLRWQPKRLS